MGIQEEKVKLNQKKKPQKRILQRNKNPQHKARSVRINYGPRSYRDLNEQLSNLSEEEKQGFTGSYKACRARVARDDDTSVVKSRAYSNMQGGRGTDTDGVTDTGGTFPITATAVAEGIGAEVKPSTE